MGQIYTLQEAYALGTPLSGIYKINFPNGKAYIGLTNNMLKRMYSHNEKDQKLGRIVGDAIYHFGKITEFEVLELIDPNNRILMSEREKYWIAYYHTWIGDPLCNGYNGTPGGEGGCTKFGLENPNSKFTEKTLYEVYDLLLNHREKSMIEIANLYNVNPDTIRNINQGKRYINPNFNYPLRTQEESNKNLLTGTKSTSAKLNEQQFLEVINLIQNSTMTFTDIAKLYNISLSAISLINKGKSYYNDNFNYPLRNKNKIKQIQYHKYT